MIKKLQRRFIRIALVALAVAMVLVVLVVNAANWISVRNELIDTLSYLPQDGEHVGRDDIGIFIVNVVYLVQVLLLLHMS